MVPALVRRLCSVAAPPRCAVCRDTVRSGTPACSSCVSALEIARPILIEPGPAGIAWAAAAAPFEGTARDLVHALKFGRRLSAARVAAVAIARVTAPRLRDLTVNASPRQAALVPVPADPLRWRWRGFDPAEEVALALARELKMPLRRCLRRRAGPRQVGRSRAARRGSPPVVNARGNVPACGVLVDDVWTTGATLMASAMALRTAGARQVAAVAIAHAGRPLPHSAPRPTIP